MNRACTLCCGGAGFHHATAAPARFPGSGKCYGCAVKPRPTACESWLLTKHENLWEAISELLIRVQKHRKYIIFILSTALALFVYAIADLYISTALKPYVTALYWLYQMRFEYLPGLGYRETGGLFIIGRDCLGNKLFICLFAVMVICRLDHYKGSMDALLRLPILCAASVLLSYAVTFIRISASLPFCGTFEFKLIHSVLSLAIYFGSVIVLYTVLSNKQTRG